MCGATASCSDGPPVIPESRVLRHLLDMEVQGIAYFSCVNSALSTCPTLPLRRLTVEPACLFPLFFFSSYLPSSLIPFYSFLRLFATTFASRFPYPPIVIFSFPTPVPACLHLTLHASYRTLKSSKPPRLTVLLQGPSSRYFVFLRAARLRSNTQSCGHQLF